MRGSFFLSVVPKASWNPDKGEVEIFADTPSPAINETGIQGTLNPIPGGIAGRSSAIDAADAAKQAQVDAASGGSE